MTGAEVPSGLRYAKTHEWVRVEGTRATIGITAHAQGELTDIVFVDLPEVGRTVATGATLLTLESVKTVADVYAPGPGRVAEVNADLKAHPELVNQEPYGKGWLVRLELTGPLSAELMDADAYRRLTGG